MILEKMYQYVTVDGKTEILNGKTSPSGLRRANVPQDLIDNYELANSNLQGISGSISPQNQRSEERSALLDKRNDAIELIEQFLEEQEIRLFGKVDIAKINLLFATAIPDNQISKGTGVSRASIGRFRNGSSDILKMPLASAVKLTRFAVRKGL